MTIGAANSLVITFADVSNSFEKLRAWMVGLAIAKRVRKSFWVTREHLIDESTFGVGEGGGYRVEWYAEADLDSGAIASFALELAWHPYEWMVDASCRLQTGDSEEVVFELPTRCTADLSDLRGMLTSCVDTLWSRRGELIAAELNYN